VELPVPGALEVLGSELHQVGAPVEPLLRGYACGIGAVDAEEPLIRQLVTGSRAFRESREIG
jgi:hypothetical protein